MNDLKVRKMALGPIETNAFLLWEENGEDAILIDAPPACATEVRRHLQDHGLRLQAIWFTHGHWDHMAGAHELTTEDDDIELLGHPDDRVMFDEPSRMAQFSIPGLELRPVTISRWLEDEDALDLWGREVRVLHCPGHCPGNVAYYLESENLCFVGDVIFCGSVGRTDLPGGDFGELERSIREKIYSLPDVTALAVGHGPDTTVGMEKSSNPFVRP